QRFKHELILARKVTHKNVVRIYDLGEADGIKFFTMEHIEGDSLKGVIRRRGRLPAAEVVPLARQILSGLHEAHEQGVIHRDLKPRAPREISAEIPDYLERVVLKCMEVDAALRYQSVPEILADLERQQVDRSLTLRAQRAVGRNKAVVLGVAAVLILVGLGL